jgi:putative transposase
VLDTLSSDRFVDKAPAAVCAELLDEDKVYKCSPRTMYRILHEQQAVRERRPRTKHPKYAKPELMANGPNQVWTWDITALRGPAKGLYYPLYVVLDMWSRYVVAWMLAHFESGELAKRLLAEAFKRQGIRPGQLVVHSDRGSVPKAKPVSLLLEDLSLTRSLSRPRVSNDNPFSESQFGTMKTRPDFPNRFDHFNHALDHSRDFFPWYNREHRHSGLKMLTPHQVHHGEAIDILAARDQVMQKAFAAHPERFVRGQPRPITLPGEVWINPPEDRTKTIIEAH